jgi:hypothetical protein
VAKQADGGSWLMAEELLERGDPAFVDELRSIHEPDKLGAFAARWYADTRPQARRLLLAYLERPLNAYRHEALVKRLYKLAEAAADDEVVARFMVAFDNSVFRVRKTRHRYDWQTRESWTEETVRVLPNTLPREPRQFRFRNPRTGERMAAKTEAEQDKLRLFSTHTRYYLRRRVWRYFRKVAKTKPDRYVAGVLPGLRLYTDEDVADGLALLDRWSLVHILFGESPAIVDQANGWQLAEGKGLNELTAAPMYEDLWQKSSAPLVDLMKTARSRTVRQWSIAMLRKHFPDALATLPLSELLELVAHEDADLAELALESLKHSPALVGLSIDAWLRLLDSANPQALDALCDLMIKHVEQTGVSFEHAVKLACSRPLPLARLGLHWLQQKQPTTREECMQLLQLAEADSESVRPQAIAWLRSVLMSSPLMEPGWLLDLLDSRHLDVRREAWTWFVGEPRIRDDVVLWQRLLESPYDDIRFQLLAYLEKQTPAIAVPRGQLDEQLVRVLWASVLLNVHRGSRAKPQVVRQIVERLERRPAEAVELLPILSVALRSVRGPEWRAGLAGIVRLIERQPEIEPKVRQMFPELVVGVG